MSVKQSPPHHHHHTTTKMIHIKPNVNYDTLYRYLDRDLEKLKKANITDFSLQFYSLRENLFSASELSFKLDNLEKVAAIPSVINALHGQTNTLKLLSSKHIDYWNFLEEWVYTVCATELLLGKRFLDFQDQFAAFYVEYNKYQIFRKNLSLTSLAWDITY